MSWKKIIRETNTNQQNYKVLDSRMPSYIASFAFDRVVCQATRKLTYNTKYKWRKLKWPKEIKTTTKKPKSKNLKSFIWFVDSVFVENMITNERFSSFFSSFHLKISVQTMYTQELYITTRHKHTEWNTTRFLVAILLAIFHWKSFTNKLKKRHKHSASEKKCVKKTQTKYFLRLCIK